MQAYRRTVKPLSHATTIALFLLITLSTSFTAWSFGSTNSINAYGTINYVPLLFESGFEDTTPVYPEHLSWDITHLINTQPFAEEHLAGAFYDIVTSQAHSGSKSLYMELSDVTQNRRIQLNIYSGKLFKSEVFVSIWLFLPSDWKLYGSNKWYELADPCFPLNMTDGDISVRLHIVQREDGAFYWRLFASSSGYDPIWDRINADVPIPRGRWFKLSYYVKRGVTDGICTVWIDDQLLFDITGNTGYPDDAHPYATMPAKIYHTTDDHTTHQLWVDNLELYGTISPW